MGGDLPRNAVLRWIRVQESTGSFAVSAGRFAVVLLVLLLTMAAGPARASLVGEGVQCLRARQAPAGAPDAGSWGDAQGSAYRDTSVVAEALDAVAAGDTALEGARSYLASTPAANQDYLSRRIAALAAIDAPPATSVAELLAGQAPEINSPSQSGYPGGGWGVAPDFDSDVLTTALALRALEQADVSAGVSVVRAAVAVGGENAHPVEVPAGATGLVIRVRGVTGTVRLFIDTPGGASFFLDLTNVTSPTNLTGLPTEAGSYTLRVRSSSGGPNVYSLEARFVDAGSFDAGRIATALSYLGFAQNADGSWGFRPGDDGSLMVTAEVLRTLAGFGGRFAPGTALDAASAWLEGRQNGDGGIGSELGVSTVYETALAGLAVSAVDPSSPALEQAIDYLVAQQQPDGCWANDAYATGVALQLIGPLFSCVLDVDGNGIAEVSTDVVYVARHLLGLAPVPPAFRVLDPTIPPDTEIATNVTAAGSTLDVDANGAVDVATDIVYVARRLLGLSPVPPQFRALDPTIPSDASISANIDALCAS